MLLYPHRVEYYIKAIHCVALTLQDAPSVLPDVRNEVLHSWVIGEVVSVVHRIKLMHVVSELAQHFLRDFVNGLEELRFLAYINR